MATLLGVTFGLVAGYYGRWIDAVVMRLADITLAFPTLLLLIAVAAAVRPSLPVVFVVIGVVGWAAMARLVRSQVLVLRSADYVLAARALGARDSHILWRHLLPNIRGPVIVAATLGIAGAIMAEAALSFVGLGAQPPTPSWGAMVADGRDLLRVRTVGLGGSWPRHRPGGDGLQPGGRCTAGTVRPQVAEPRLGFPLPRRVAPRTWLLRETRELLCRCSRWRGPWTRAGFPREDSRGSSRRCHRKSMSINDLSSNMIRAARRVLRGGRWTGSCRART